MRATGRFILILVAACALHSAPIHAQNLATFVNEAGNGASALQVSAGNAVQRACGTLAGQGGFTLTGAAGDLFLRCNELVQTAQFLQGNTGVARNLGLEAPDLLAAVQQIAGEEMFSQTTLSTRVTNGQFANIAGRLNALRLGNANTAIGGRLAYSDPMDDGRSSPGYGRLSLDETSFTGGAASADDIAGRRGGWFLEGSFNTGDRDQTANEDGFDFDSTSFTLGIDYLMDSGVIGVAAGIDNYEADFENSALVAGGNVEVEGTSGTLFGAFNFGSVFVNGLVSFGSLDSDTSRSAVYASNNTCPVAMPCPGENDTLVGETDGEFLSGGATLGYDTTRGNWDISTTISLAYRDIDIDGYTESDPAGGGLSLSYADQNIESFRAILGVAFTGTYSRDFGVLRPHFRAEWHHEFEDDPVPLLAKYAAEETLTGVAGAAGPGVFSLDTTECFSCFQINSDEIDSDFGLVGVGVSAVFARRIQVYAMYEALLGIDDISSNSFSVGLRGQF